MNPTEEKAFLTLLAAIEPWLDQAVIVGGWAHRLHRNHPAAQPVDHPPVTTLDTDVAMPLDLAVRPQDLRERLMSHGFTEELLGNDQPPSTHYHLGGEGDGFYAEFLTPLVGSEHDRQGRRKATMTLAGVTAQRLRHIELLLERPWVVDLKTASFAGSVRVPNPITFLAQKLLIQSKRQRSDRAKDILYIHDTLEVFGSRLEALRELWRDEIAPRLSGRTAAAVVQNANGLFGALNDDVRRAAQASAERSLSAAAIREACQYGLTYLFD